MVAAHSRTEARSARSSATTCTSSLSERSFTSAAAALAFSRCRQARTVVAPVDARPTAVSLPMPLLAPVTTTTLPCIASSSGSVATATSRRGIFDNDKINARDGTCQWLDGVNLGTMARAPVKPYHHGHLREAVLEAAVAEIEALGPARLSMREIARRAGVSHAAPAHHFGDKAGI